MPAHVWINWVVGALMLLAFAGGPPWIAFRYPDTPPDFTEANGYLAAKAAAAAVAGRVPAPRAAPAPGSTGARPRRLRGRADSGAAHARGGQIDR